MTSYPMPFAQLKEAIHSLKKNLRRGLCLFFVTLLILTGTEICPNYEPQGVFAQWDHADPNVTESWNHEKRSSINNYVHSYDNFNDSVTPTYTASALSQPPNEYYGNPGIFSGDVAYSPQPEPGGYLAMGNRPVFRSNHAQTLVPQFPSYDHWSEMPEQPWTLQRLPKGLIFPSYLAGMKEPRLATMWGQDDNFKWIWDATLGGRAGLLRFGTPNAVLPEGIQLDIEGAVLLRMDMEHGRNMMANDFRAGVPLTFGGREWQFKTGYYHVSSHMGDHHLLRTGEMRINYVRDALVFAVARRFWNDWRAYTEAAWAFYTGIETEPWEFQFGLEYAPIYPAAGFRGSPFAAIHLHLFQELDFSGYFCCQLGWQWRGADNQLFRLGVQYMNGYDDQFQFHHLITNKIGFGIWYDF